MKVKGYRILVIADEVDKKTDWGFEIVSDADKAKIAQMYGTVHQVGDQCWHDYDGEPWCKPGDRVCWSKFAGKFVRDEEGNEYVILNDVDILAVLKEA